MVAQALRVVLVEPQIPANLGFIARVLANFGVEDAIQVGGTHWRDTEAERTGAPARSHLEALGRTDTLAEALAGCTQAIGFTARRGRQRRPLPLAELPALLRSFGPEAFPALVFGREDRGLEADEVEACGHLVTIPTAGMSSLNLSHAVAVALYECRRQEEASSDRPASPPSPRWASDADKGRAADQARFELDRADFREHPEHLDGFLRRLQAQSWEARDLRVMERILRHVRWLRERGNRPSP